jgi:hypothetical protein
MQASGWWTTVHQPERLGCGTGLLCRTDGQTAIDVLTAPAFRSKSVGEVINA